MLKKVSIILIAFSLLVPVNGVFADTQNQSGNHKVKVLEKNERIKDIRKLKERAESGITDLNEESIGLKPKILLRNKNNGKEKSWSPLITTQLLKKVKRNNKTTSTYATTILYSTNEIETQEASTINSASSVKPDECSIGSNTIKCSMDETGPVMVSSTIFYTYNTIGITSYIDMNGVSGYWEINDSDYSVTNREVNFHQAGIGSDGVTYSVFSQSESHEDPNLTFFYDAPSEWVPVKATSSSDFALTMNADVTGRSDSYELTMLNEYSLNPYSR